MDETGTIETKFVGPLPGEHIWVCSGKQAPGMDVVCGVDNAGAVLRALRGMRVGLITNHTGLSATGEPTANVLINRYGINVIRLFGPEHGIWGDVPDLDHVADAVEPLTGLPVLSLFGENLAPTRDALRDLDALVFDIQDIGSRYYTFPWTMVKCMEAAAKAGNRFVVLDRPNPITGLHLEGNVSQEGFLSFVGLCPFATRHGMTVGEIARYANAEFHMGTDLNVVEVQRWHRGMWFDQTGLVFVPPSPNTTGLAMATVYPGTCLFEGTNLSEGRGTTQPFEVIGAPFINPFEFAHQLNSRQIPGVWFRPLHFIPYTSEHAGVRCGGVQVHVLDRNLLNAFDVGLHMLCVAHAIPGFEWKNDPQTYSIDWLAGTDELRLAIDQGATPDELKRAWAPGLTAFAEARSKHLLYGDVESATGDV